MADLAFPQLSNGSQVQYPLRKRRITRCPANAFADGSMITGNSSAYSQQVWEMVYRELSSTDQNALENHFRACRGPLLAFVFVDPTDNMIGYSTNLKTGTWQADPLLSVAPNAVDPFGGTNAFTLVNSGQVDQKLSQRIPASANFQYCFSIFAAAASPTSLTLGRSAALSQNQTFPVSSGWTRLANCSQLPDNGLTFTVSVIVPAGQTVVVFGPQLEPQRSPSRYRPTAASGGVYLNAHFLGDSITFESDAPGLFSTLISIETT